VFVELLVKKNDEASKNVKGSVQDVRDVIGDVVWSWNFTCGEFLETNFVDFIGEGKAKCIAMGY
jgi:hypothetical protein